ncbi:Putative uncharacterized protein [Lactococcus lactis subsp. lactis A12]|nr:Putative uncharacterized protein [Lactococcus lactis subsp. lactis A12]
MNDKIL